VIQVTDFKRPTARPTSSAFKQRRHLVGRACPRAGASTRPAWSSWLPATSLGDESASATFKRRWPHRRHRAFSNDGGPGGWGACRAAASSAPRCGAQWDPRSAKLDLDRPSSDINGRRPHPTSTGYGRRRGTPWQGLIRRDRTSGNESLGRRPLAAGVGASSTASRSGAIVTEPPTATWIAKFRALHQCHSEEWLGISSFNSDVSPFVRFQSTFAT